VRINPGGRACDGYPSLPSLVPNSSVHEVEVGSSAMVETQFEELDRHNHTEVRALILEGLRDHWGSVDEALNPDLDDMMSSYRTGRTVVVRGSVGTIVGSGTIVPRPEGVAEILRMSVDRSVRRSGVGRAIVDELLETARSWSAHM